MGKKDNMSFVDMMRPYQLMMLITLNQASKEDVASIYGYSYIKFEGKDLYYKVWEDGWEVVDEPTGSLGNKMIFTIRIDEALECFRNQPDIFPDFNPKIYSYYEKRGRGNNAINKAMYGE